jgi:glycosyltransferase involved in cell wall biosynthesis
MRVVYFTKYTRNGASSRLRSYQYFKSLANYGFDCKYLPLHSDKYLDLLYRKKFRLLEAGLSYFIRLLNIFTLNRKDIIVIEKELFPYVPAVFEFFLRRLGFHFIVDFDDAIHHNYDKHTNGFISLLLKNKIPNVMKYASHVIVGNSYLMDFANINNILHVTQIPTVIDETKYCRVNRFAEAITIGWIGTPYTSIYLNRLLPIFSNLYKKYGVKVLLIGASPKDFELEFIDCVSWSEDTEVADIQKIDIGIMPLKDGFFERGKCGYKLIQYMACGIPVIASPVGENCFIVDHGENGFLADSLDDWESLLEELVINPKLRKDFGMSGFKKIQQKYSISSQLLNLVKVLSNGRADI